ncbi:N-acyl-D-amino-acid deacylase family protein [Sphingomonas montanisoli]|uniref:Amidohydrolase family protein n=1 Tax=Sphingomonas montanisoli TaxID=2606412 RepID=A0A5D9BZT8_9SPHN|nr:amidohydrolase family protein [Sphingomonas montanisoli]TZG24984.1 amidohydrolase family protein [Sphingomonas montanisoli]
MSYNILIKNGTVIDGQNKPAFKADVRIAGGKIVKVAETIEREGVERVVDATGCYVTPGFIETHNHYDAPMWWMPNMFPLPGYGITTTVNGNCGFGAAPVHPTKEAKDAMIGIFSFFEDIPLEPFHSQLPWDWKTWGEYRDSMLRNLKVPINFEFFCGHQALRLAAMGIDATKRAANDEEIRVMADMLREALKAGACGFSSNTMDYDGQGNPVPSLLADDKEFSALFDVLDEFPGKTFEVIISIFQRFTGVEDMQRLVPLVKDRKFKTQWAGVPTLTYQLGKVAPLVEEHERYKAEGYPLYTGFTHVAPATMINFNSPLTFGQTNLLAWVEVAEETNTAKKLELLQSEEWRERARQSWEEMYPQAMFRRPESVIMRDSQYRVGPYGSEVTFQDVIDARKDNAHPSDVLADWVLDNGIGSTLGYGMSKASMEQIINLFKDENALGNISDSGAHAQMLCGIGDHINMITTFARDNDWLTIEQAVYNLTGKLANFFGFTDRGHIAEGKTADIAIWNIDEVERRPMIKEFDVPDGSGGRGYRYTRDAAPMRMTMVHGEPIFDGGSFTGAYPGRIAGHETHEAFAEAQAAE